MLPERSFVGMSTWDGTLSPDEFRTGALAFAEKWDKLSHNHDLPRWSWVSCLNSPFVSSNEAGGYLSLEKMCIFRSDKIDDDGLDHSGKEEPSCLESEVSADPAILVQQDADEVHYYDFHIVYSNAYKIPVLYFRGYNSGGRNLMLDQIEMDLPVNSAKLLTETKWTFITQQEHPYLNRPWYSLHPCGTNDLMSLLLSDISLPKETVTAEGYLVSWFSVVSQVVGIRLPLQMATSHQTWTFEY